MLITALSVILVASAAPSEVAVDKDEPRSGWMNIGSDPSGATVLIDGEPVVSKDGTLSVTPLRAVALEFGRAYKITIVKDGYWPKVHEVVLAPEQTSHRVFSLLRPLSQSGEAKGLLPAATSSPVQTEPEPCVSNSEQTGHLTMNAQPPAVVYLGEERLGETPFGKVRVPSGCITLRVIWPETKTERVLRTRVEPNRATRMSIKL